RGGSRPIRQPHTQLGGAHRDDLQLARTVWNLWSSDTVNPILSVLTPGWYPHEEDAGRGDGHRVGRSFAFCRSTPCARLLRRALPPQVSLLRRDGLDQRSEWPRLLPG